MFVMVSCCLHGIAGEAETAYLTATASQISDTAEVAAVPRESGPDDAGSRGLSRLPRHTATVVALSIHFPYAEVLTCRIPLPGSPRASSRPRSAGSSSH